ncbi:uncharacterized protein LOC122024705 isoform X1 [Zingiber officinale]|uniref:uncharacterized protein LOC122024705 isoform X1 n=1 Tax=Zingiber officinale TaxID=94328 RepID=UPI001C4C4BDD|nr:uncharacterized protein LOC122024705 isoform X1 [Zingiber officinale]
MVDSRMKMAGSTRTESASSSMDGPNFAPAYQNGQRGTHLGPGLERSGGFRESLENRSLFAGPGTLRNAASSSEIPTVLQYLPFEIFSWVEQKCSRTGEIRRVLGVTVEDHTFGSAQSKPIPPIAPEDLKRLKGNIYESSNRARERSKLLHDSVVKLDRYRNLVSRRRQRTDQSNDKSGTSNPVKMGSQTHQSPTELASPRLEDRKNAVPNKRIRSSMAEVRSEVRGAIPPRQGVVEKDRNVLFEKDKTMHRGCNGGTVPSEDKMCGLPPMGDGWDKKMKRKRSVGLNRVMESDREIKSIQQRPSNESRMRSSDGIAFRPGLSSGTTVNNKMDGCSQPSVANSRGTPKIDLDGGSVPNERREFSSGFDNERMLLKGGNKLNVHEDAQAGNQSPLVKGKASRGPRTVSGASVNASPSFLRSSGNMDGWEQASGANKVQSATVTNRKRPVPNESSSPPVTQWGGQRPQKISRTRRVNVVSPVSNLDEAQFLTEGYVTPEAGVRMTTMDTSGLLVPRVMSSKLKLDNVLSPSVLSESEESAAVESKFKDKGNDSFELEDGAQTSLKTSSFLLPTKKNKTPPKEEIGDGVRRQGRSGRSSVQSKACLPLAKEKMESIDTTKPLKNKKIGPERSESRIGRPPSKKMSDRKAYARPQIMISSESAGASIDDRDDLLAAANDARNANGNACSSCFWKKMEPIFAFPTLEEISYVKHQIHFAEEVDASLSNLPEANHEVEIVCDVASPHSSFASKQIDVVRPTNKTFGPSYSSDGKQLDKTSVGRSETKRKCHKMVPLSQRLLSAFISEDESEKIDNDIQDETLFLYSRDYIYTDSNSHVIDDDLELDYKNHKRSLGDGFIASNNFKHVNIQNLLFGHEPLVENNAMLKADNAHLSDYLKNNCTQLEAMGNSSSYRCQFEEIPLDDRILMELHSIGLFPETVPDLSEGVDGEIDKVISELQMRLLQQVRQKKDQLSKLEKAIQDAKEIEERKLEQLAMDKLVEMAYKKLMGGRGSSNHKTGVTKVAKQLAMAFGKRTLERCHIFEKTGRSCFSESPLQDVLLSGPPNNIDTGHSDGFGSVNYVDLRSEQFGVRQSGVMAARSGLGNKMDRGPSDPYRSIPQMGEHSVSKRKKEVLLDDVTGVASRSLSTHTHSLATSTKWKKAERDQEQNKDPSGRSSTAKAGRPSLSSGRGERKLKTKPKQKIAQLSTSGNGLGRVTETDNVTSPALREAFEMVNSSIAKFDQEVELQTSSNRAPDSSKEFDDGIFTNLPLNGIDPMDELDVAEGLGGQGQDIASWLNVDEEALQDHDLVGLEIPMDDLSELKLNF